MQGHLVGRDIEAPKKTMIELDGRMYLYSSWQELRRLNHKITELHESVIREIRRVSSPMLKLLS